MELQELLVAEWQDVDFLIPATNQGAQVTTQHFGIAASYDDLGIRFCGKASYSPLKAVYVLNFIHKYVIHFPLNILALYVFIQILIGLDGIELFLLLVYIYDIVACILLLDVANHI